MNKYIRVKHDFYSVQHSKYLLLKQFFGMSLHLTNSYFTVLSSLMTYHRVCTQINTTGVTSGAGTAYPSRAPEFTPGFQWDSRYSIFSFICMFCRSLFVILYFFFWPLCCLFLFDIRILITLWYLQTLFITDTGVFRHTSPTS